MGDLRLMKGNEVIAEAAIRCGCDGYFGYPITPQSEIMETLMARRPWEETGMVVLQAESEGASINMIYGGASSGKKVMTSSSRTWVANNATFAIGLFSSNQRRWAWRISTYRVSARFCSGNERFCRFR